jgi:putative polyhydroxyalkanoate system protein
MAGFEVSKLYTMTKEEVRKGAEELARELHSQHGLRTRWHGDTATFTRSGVDGRLSIDNERISLSVKLGFLASAFERPLKQAVTNYLDEYVS